MCPQHQCVTRHLGHAEMPQSMKMSSCVCPSCWTAQCGAELVRLILGAAAGLNTRRVLQDWVFLGCYSCFSAEEKS